METRLGRQTPTTSVILPYSNTIGSDAISEYNATGNVAQEWQELLVYDILAINDDGLYVHTKFGYSIPRRNGKGEILTIREMDGLKRGEKILHTAHRTTTSSSASKRLAKLLEARGYEEILRPKKGESYEKCYTYAKQYGLERITFLDTGGTCDFRTRTSSGGLGEGFDLLVIDEAQEYTDEQETTLKYTVSDSKNPQTILCGTPPTAVSSGTVFVKMRNACLQGETQNTGWAEWSVENQADPNDKELWYETNPSLGTILTERKIGDEIGGNVVDFNIQRLGLWLKYNQKSAISENEWKELKVDVLPKICSKLYVGIKYGLTGERVAMSIAVKTENEKIFVESIDCRNVRSGNSWILSFLQKADVKTIVCDGASGQNILQADLKNERMQLAVLPTVKEIISANSLFTQGIAQKTICHNNQPSLTQVVTNCEKRTIGSNGGFGYRAQIEGMESALMDSVILAYWACATDKKEIRKQKVSY